MENLKDNASALLLFTWNKNVDIIFSAHDTFLE